MSDKYTVTAERGDKFTTFSIEPPLTVGELVRLPRPRFHGSHGIDTIDFVGVWPDRDGVSVVGFESRAFGSNGTDLEKFMEQMTTHLGLLATEQGSPAPH
jgi:hypothetical protein